MTAVIPPVEPAADVVGAGAVLWRLNGTEPGSPEVALVHRPRYDDWTLPKGKLEPGESVLAAAVREVAEETGHRARLGARLGEVRYPVPEGDKLVHYWSAEALSGGFAPNREVDALRWVRAGDAGELVSYQRDADVLARFTALGPADGLVLLVRHGKAGRRAGWPGPDELRPLSVQGRRQASALRDLLVVFGPDRVYSAPPARCVQTVQPLADSLGLEIVIEPLLGEEGYAAQAEAGLRRLVEIGAQGGVSVVCSQGGMIPDAIRELAVQSGRDDGMPGLDGSVEARKGSLWVLGMRAKRLLLADYYPPPA